MPIEHTWYEGGLHTRYLGRVSGEDMLQACLDVAGDSRLDELRWIIGDWSGCTESLVTIEDVQQLCSLLKPIAQTNPHIASLVVMRPDINGIAFTNLYMFLSDELPWFVMGYRTLDEVKSWLRQNLSVEL